MNPVKPGVIVRLKLVSCLALSAPFSALFAAPPEVPASIAGELQVFYHDDFANKRSELVHYIQDERTGKQYRLRSTKEIPGHLRHGAKVIVKGSVKGEEFFLAADGTEQSSVELIAPASLAVTGTQNTIVMVGNFSDVATSCSTAAISSLMFTDPMNKSVDDLYQETSGGRVSFGGSTIGPFAINYASTDACNYSAWATAIDAAATAARIDLTQYKRKVYVLPGNSCPAAGVSTVGGNPSRSWIFTCNIADVYAHELGHALGMDHSATPTADYGDNSDVMGAGGGPLTQINAPHKEQMGWVAPEKITTVTTSGIYNLAALALDPLTAGAAQALKIAKPDTNEFYYLSLRRPIGFDTNLSTQYLDRLTVHRYKGDASATRTYLLSTLVDGGSFTDSTNGVTVTQLSRSGDYVTVQVQLATTPTPCTSATPLLTLSPSSQSGAAGARLSYSVSLTNRDGASCAQRSFPLSSVVATGWTASVSPSSFTLAPGAVTTATLLVTSASNATVGTYNVQAKAVDSANAAAVVSATGTYTVQGDIQAPTVPSGLAARIKRGQVSLSWYAASDNVAVTGYEVWRNGVMLGKTGGLTYGDPVSSGTYTYYLIAYDAAGNRSSASGSVTARIR